LALLSGRVTLEPDLDVRTSLPEGGPKVKIARYMLVAVGLLVSTAVGVAAQDKDTAAQAPVEFGGRLLFGPQIATGTDTVAEGRTEVRGSVFSTPVAEMSDPRLDGTVTRTNNIDIYDDPAIWTWHPVLRRHVLDYADAARPEPPPGLGSSRTARPGRSTA
jgi:hypothetical protein